MDYSVCVRGTYERLATDSGETRKRRATESTTISLSRLHVRSSRSCGSWFFLYGVVSSC